MSSCVLPPRRPDAALGTAPMTLDERARAREEPATPGEAATTLAREVDGHNFNSSRDVDEFAQDSPRRESPQYARLRETPTSDLESSHTSAVEDLVESSTAPNYETLAQEPQTQQRSEQQPQKSLQLPTRKGMDERATSTAIDNSTSSLPETRQRTPSSADASAQETSDQEESEHEGSSQETSEQEESTAQEQLPREMSSPRALEAARLLLVACAGCDFDAVRELLKAKVADVNCCEKQQRYTPLHYASSRGNRAITVELIEHGASVNRRDVRGRTPLHYAADKSVVFALVAGGAYVSAKDSQDEKTPLHVAGLQQHQEVILALIANGADIQSRTRQGDSPLHTLAARRITGTKDVAETLLANGANIEGRNSLDRTPLHVAAEHGNYELACVLLAHGAHVNVRDTGDWTPLHVACTRRDLNANLVALLLSQGALVHARTARNLTALHLAAENGALDVVRALLTAQAQPNAEDSEHNTPLHRACMKDGEQQLPIAKALLAYGALVDKQNSNYCTPLQVASHSHKRTEVVELLLDRGAKVNATTYNTKWNSLHFAADAGSAAIVSLLLERGASVNARAYCYGWTPLHLASMYGHREAVLALLAGGADASIRNKSGRTVRQLAVDHNQYEVAGALAANGILL